MAGCVNDSIIFVVENDTCSMPLGVLNAIYGVSIAFPLLVVPVALYEATRHPKGSWDRTLLLVAALWAIFIPASPIAHMLEGNTFGYASLVAFFLLVQFSVVQSPFTWYRFYIVVMTNLGAQINRRRFKLILTVWYTIMGIGRWIIFALLCSQVSQKFIDPTAWNFIWLAFCFWFSVEIFFNMMAMFYYHHLIRKQIKQSSGTIPQEIIQQIKGLMKFVTKTYPLNILIALLSLSNFVSFPLQLVPSPRSPAKYLWIIWMAVNATFPLVVIEITGIEHDPNFNKLVANLENADKSFVPVTPNSMDTASVPDASNKQRVAPSNDLNDNTTSNINDV